MTNQRKQINPLCAVFWDYPDFTNQEYLRQCLQQPTDPGMYHWMLQRFLEHGRVVDTLQFFSIEAIAAELPRLSLQPDTVKKWRRMVEVYAPATRT